MVYQVNEIVHSFGGQFTQTLSLVKHPASTFKEVKPELEMISRLRNPSVKKYTNIPELVQTKKKMVQKRWTKRAGTLAKVRYALVDTDKMGSEQVQNTDAAYLAASGAYKNATSLFIDNNGVDGIPEEADAKQLALVTAQLDDLCTLGNQAACADLRNGRQQIANHFGEADEARNTINESIDDGTTVSPATIAMLDNTYEALGQEKISDGVVGVDQDEIDGLNKLIKHKQSYLETTML